MHLRRCLKALGVVAPLVILAWSSVPAAAEPADAGAPLPPAAVHNPTVPLSVIRALPLAIQDDSTISIDPKLDPTVPIVYADGAPVPGQSARAMKMASSCATYVAALPGGSWSPAVRGNCAVAGHPGYQLTYSWSTAPQVNSSACAQGTGFPSGKPPVTWYNIGCGKNGSYWVPWGNSLAQPLLKARSITILAGTTIIVDF